MKFSIRRPSAIVAAGVLALAGALVQAPQSSADVIGGSSAVITGPTTGVVGVPMTMAIQVTDSWTPGVSLTLTPQGSNSGGAAPITISNIVSGQTQNFTFVPPHVGSFTFTVASDVTSLSCTHHPSSARER
jgi:hypothetical protein